MAPPAGRETNRTLLALALLVRVMGLILADYYRPRDGEAQRK